MRSTRPRATRPLRLCATAWRGPTAACFSRLDTDPYYKLGRKIADFGNGYPCRDVRHGRPVWVIPILVGEFVINRRFGCREGLMGGDRLGARRDHAVSRRRRGQRVESRQQLFFLIASTYETFCPALRGPTIE